MKDWMKASCNVKFTPLDVYDDEYGTQQMIADLPPQLKIVGFRIPGTYEHYINSDGYVIENDGQHTLNKPYFILELNPNDEGKVVCYHCHYDGMLESWAPGTDHVGCVQCGRSLSRIWGRL